LSRCWESFHTPPRACSV